MAKSFLEPVSPALVDVLAFFRERFADVAFPNADVPALEAQADEVRALAARARQLEEETERVYAAMDTAHTELAHRASVALRYARIFAADDGALRRAIDAVALPGDPPPPVEPAPKRAKRRALER